jgi:hypothetical protein
MSLRRGLAEDPENACTAEPPLIGSWAAHGTIDAHAHDLPATMAWPASCQPTPKRSGCFTSSHGVDVGFLVTVTPTLVACSLHEPHCTSGRQTNMLYPHLSRGMHTRGRPSFRPYTEMLNLLG